MALGRYNEPLFVNGRLAPNVSCKIVLANTSTLAALFSDSTGSTALPNPVASDPAGNLAFYAEAGYYDIIINNVTSPGIAVSAPTDGTGTGGGGDVTEHANAPAPHTGHSTPAEVNAAVETGVASHSSLPAPHSGHETLAGAQGRVDTHANAAAPHAGHETPAGAQDKVNAHNLLPGADVHGGLVSLGHESVTNARDLKLPTAPVNFNGQRQINVGTPVSPNDGTPKSYTDAVATGLRDKASVRAATTAALPANTRAGNVLTASANGAFPTQDGQAITVGQRVLVKNEGGTASHVNNGLYSLTNAGSGTTAWVLTRTTDADADAEVTPGLTVFVELGTVHGKSKWTLITAAPITVNTTSLEFTQTDAGGGTPSGAATGDLAGNYPNPTVRTAIKADRDGWEFPGDIAPGVATAPHKALWPETLTSDFVAQLFRAPVGRDAILDLKKHVGGAGVGASVFVDAAARPKIVAGTKNAVIGALGSNAFLDTGDELRAEIIQAGLSTVTQAVRVLGSNDAGTTSGTAIPVPYDSPPVAGEKIVVIISMGGASLNPTPFPMTGVTEAGFTAVLEVSGGTFGLNIGVYTKDAGASEVAPTFNAASGNRPWSIAVQGVTGGEAGVAGIANAVAVYGANQAAPIAPEPMPTSNNDFNGIIINFFAARATDPDTTTTGQTPTVSGTPHESFIELVDRDSNRLDLANVAVMTSWRAAIAEQPALSTAEKTLTLAGSNATFNAIAGTLVVKQAGGHPGSDLTFEIVTVPT